MGAHVAAPLRAEKHSVQQLSELGSRTPWNRCRAKQHNRLLSAEPNPRSAYASTNPYAPSLARDTCLGKGGRFRTSVRNSSTM